MFTLDRFGMDSQDTTTDGERQLFELEDTAILVQRQVSVKISREEIQPGPPAASFGL